MVGVQGFKGCILITIRHFAAVLYGKTDRFHIPTNLPAIADLLGYARSLNDRRGRRVWNMAFGNDVAKATAFTRIWRSNFNLFPNLER